MRSPEDSIESIQKDRLAGSCFTGEHREPGLELEFKTINQGNVLQLQTGEHKQNRWSG